MVGVGTNLAQPQQGSTTYSGGFLFYSSFLLFMKDPIA